MKLFFVSQCFIAALLMVWNATKKGFWEYLPSKKTPSEGVALSKIDPKIPASPEISREVKSLLKEDGTAYLTKNDLPHFEESLVLPMQNVREQLPSEGIQKATPSFAQESNLVSSFTKEVLNPKWEFFPESTQLSKADAISAFHTSSVIQENLFPRAPLIQDEMKSPLLAAALSVIPGVGHAYLGDLQTAGSLIGSAAVGYGLFIPQYYSDSFYDESSYLSSMTFAQVTEFYGIYAAYRDARASNGMAGYAYKMPTENLLELARAPFDLQVLKKPEVWGGILGALGLAAGTIWLAYPSEARIQPCASTSDAMIPLLALPVGIGEEAFYRGFLQSALAEQTSPVGGIVLSSLAFGLSHLPNALAIDSSMRLRYCAVNIPLITALGSYFGWLTYKNGSLKESVAVHTWYDFALMASTAFASYSASTGKPGFATSLRF